MCFIKKNNRIGESFIQTKGRFIQSEERFMQFAASFHAEWLGSVAPRLAASCCAACSSLISRPKK